jgi:hypothetical protein
MRRSSSAALLYRGSGAAERLLHAAAQEHWPIPVELRSAMAQLTSVWAMLRASVERVSTVDSEPPERLRPVLGLLTRIGNVVRTLREQAKELGLAQWRTALEESLQDLSTVHGAAPG